MIKFKFTWYAECLILAVQAVYFLLAYLFFNYGNTVQNYLRFGPPFGWSTVTLHPYAWGNEDGHGPTISAGFVAFAYNAIEQFLTIAAGIVLSGFLFRGIIDNQRASLARRIGIQEFHHEVRNGDGASLMAAAITFLHKQNRLVFRRVLIICFCGFLTFCAVQGVQSLTQTVTCPVYTYFTTNNQSDISWLFQNRSTSDGTTVYEMYGGGWKFRPLPYWNMLHTDTTMEVDGFLSFAATNCWCPNVNENTTRAIGLCEGTMATCEPYDGNIGIHAFSNYSAAGWVWQSDPGFESEYMLNFTGNANGNYTGQRWPLNLDVIGVSVLNPPSNTTPVASIWNVTIGIMTPYTPNDTQWNNTIPAKSITSTLWTNITRAKNATSSGWYVMKDPDNFIYDRSFWIGTCNVSFWRNNKTTFNLVNNSTNRLFTKPEPLNVTNPGWKPFSPTDLAPPEGLLGAWQGLGAANSNVTFIDPLFVNNLTAHIINAAMSVSHKVNSTKAPKLSPAIRPGWREQQTIYNCQQVTFWPYILVAIWMVPVLCYNLWDLINSRNERRARSIIRDQTLTAAGLIHVYALHARSGHEVGEKMRNTVKENELLDIYEHIDTHVQHNDDDVYWDAAMTLEEPPSSPYSSPYTPEWNMEWSTSPPESWTVMQTHPSAVSPQLSPSPLGSPSLPASPTRMPTRRQRLFRMGTSSDGMAEPLLESEHHEYYDSEGIPLSTWSGRRRR